MASARIMHIDDEPDIREVVQLSLARDAELIVRSFPSGVEAAEAAVDWPPDLLLIDFMMPKVDGVATLAMLRQNPSTKATPVVFMTGRAQTRDVEFLMSLGAAGVLAKPFEPITLAGTLRDFLRPKPPKPYILRDEFLCRAKEYAVELTHSGLSLAGSDREDELDHARQIAHRLAGGAGIHGYHVIGTDAGTLEEALRTEKTDLVIQGAITTLVHTIAVAANG